MEFYDSDHSVIHPNFVHTAVKILSARDGRQSIVRACRKVIFSEISFEILNSLLRSCINPNSILRNKLRIRTR